MYRYTPARGSWIAMTIVAAAVAVSIAGAPRARAQERPPLTALIPPDSAAWQKRREQRIDILRTEFAKPGAPNAAFDQMVTAFEAHPVDQTPLENLDLIGAWYASRDGILKVLPQIVMNVTLGYYDTLRFASASGQEQILNGEGLFKRALLLAGKPRIEEYVAVVNAHPEQIRAAVQEGLAMADKVKDTTSYDRNWPSAYGLEHTVCALGGECPRPPGAEPYLWPGLWAEARDKVSAYFKG